MSYLFAFLAITFIIFVHELGHFITAKQAGMKVERFGIGMGPTIQIGKLKLAFTRGDTEYCICWFPIGGFCQIKGEEEDTSEPDSYNAKPPWSKFKVAFSGPFTNILVAFVILVVLFMSVGDPSYFAQVQEVREGLPAIEAGFKPDDIIIGLNTQRTVEWTKIQSKISTSAGQPIEIIVQRGEQEITLPVTPVLYDGISVIGVMVKGYPKKLGVGESILYTFRKMGTFFKQFLLFIGRVFTGNIRSEEVGGIFSIYKVAKQSAAESMSSLLFFIAFLSLNLGVLNLFPFPPLDGGKIVFALFEALLRRKINKKAEIWINVVGFVLLMGLMIYVNFLDIKNLILSQFK